jgi:hypothetical protein
MGRGPYVHHDLVSLELCRVLVVWRRYHQAHHEQMTNQTSMEMLRLLHVYQGSEINACTQDVTTK